VKFGLLYLTDYYPEVHGAYTTYYEQMLEQIVTAEALGCAGVWFAEHRIPTLPLGMLMCYAAWSVSRVR
jgi:alkanesulfonate monooxygenase SsuD/methylene tetrahydromethanopterin reductase-like flavin-dependent oxidoreductase (luciferase family)